LEFFHSKENALDRSKALSIKKTGHGDTSSDTAVSLKKGNFTTPPVFSFFKKKTAA